MRLKSLEIKGFKSFADKTTILLDNAITGIVGPNGCGKSNIIDAIRWVIGEHKIKSLRSDNLEDLIFNGSKSRNASGMAEVSLTFDNTKNILPTEFTSVTITRKFYKNGDSEYRLNDVACRLKDIHNLFLDTGVSNDSYAIIELGMVDDIIKDKDGSRRRMLEQAAGISIYKARKKEAKQKLDGTQQDISRIEDLLFEIGNNLRTLESQARKAEKYFQFKNEYKNISIELAIASLEEFNEKYQSLKEEEETHENEKLKIETEIAGDEAQIEENKLKLIHMEQALHVAQKEFNDLVNRIRGLENEKKLTSQRLEHLNDRAASIQNFLKNAESQENNILQYIEESEVNIEKFFDEVSLLEEKIEDLKIILEEKKEKFDTKKSELEVNRNNLLNIQREKFEVEKNVAIADTSLANLNRSFQQIIDDKKRRLIQSEQHQEELKVHTTQSEELQKDIKELETIREDAENKLFIHQSEIEKFREELIERNRQLDAKKNEYELLNSLIQSWEGYPESIQFLSQSKEWASPAPLLSELLMVDNDYKKALENVLDEYINFYIVDNAAQAEEAIQLLKQHQKGKAHFLLLDKIPLSTPKKIDNPNWVHALDVINIDSKYQNLANWLLGNVYITDAEFSEIQISQDISVVSKDGSFYTRNERIGGGSVGLFEGNKIGRTKTLELLKSDIEKLEKDIADIKEKIAFQQTIITGLDKALNDKTIHQKNQQFAQVNQQLFNIKNKLEHLDNAQQADEKRLEDIEKQIQDIKDNVGGKHDVLDNLIAKLTEQEEVIKRLQIEFADIEQDYNLSSQQLNQLTIQLSQFNSQLDNAKQQKTFREKQLEDLKAQIESNKNQYQETQEQISETSGKLNFGDDELHELLSKKQTEEQSLSLKDNEFYTFRNQVAEHEKSITQQRRQKEAADSKLQEVREKINAMKLQVAGLKERLNVEFKVDLDEVLNQERTSDKSIEEMQEEADKIKKRLDNMGDINPTAIEAYNEMKVRYDFIVSQKKDLEDARDSLLATIEEVELTANTKFRETFDKVRENFIQVFKALFTEDDNADLRLTDPENVAESGIEIYAQPKGKRPSTLTQLSGGEKTLTSTAFLFAIYLIKPAPFCILDEVDAPLDDANVGKFTSMIRKFSDNSQFIIVTHNKQTMAAVDVIYGVTMQEAGVSKLVPVDFRSLN